MSRNEFVVSPYIYYTREKSNEIMLNNILVGEKSVINNKIEKLIIECKTKKKYQWLIEKFGGQLVDEAIDNKIILEEDKKWNSTRYRYIEIEINTDCNYRCEYCPVRNEPKERKVMSIEAFKEVINKVKKYENIEKVSFSFYNEPTLDPYFLQRIDILKENNLKLILHTNGSMLSKAYIDYLCDSNVVDIIYFNFPNYDKKIFTDITRNPLYDKVVENIDYAVSRGLNIDFSIQKTDANYRENIDKMNEIYGYKINKKIVAWDTVDRAGLLKNKYNQNVNLNGKLFGCKKVLEWLFVDVNGNCFICFNDFYVKNVFGNILESEIQDIIDGEKYAILMKKLFGDVEASEDFLCRSCYEMKLMAIYSKLSDNLEKVMEND